MMTSFKNDSSKVQQDSKCDLTQRLLFSALGGLLGAVNISWLAFVSINKIDTRFSESYIGKWLNLTELSLYMLFIPAFFSTFCLFPSFCATIKKINNHRKVGVLQIWQRGISFGISASSLTALFIIIGAILYNASKGQPFDLANATKTLLLLVAGPTFLATLAIFFSFPAFLMSGLLFAWLTFKYQTGTKS